MGRFIIDGARPLDGEVTVSGSKNAALPVIFAALITRGISEISSLPDIEDVRVAIGLIRELGAVIESSDGVTYIDTRCLSYVPPSVMLVNKIRASTYLLGSELARFGRAELSSFGGCSFSARPIDMHLSALQLLGAKIDGNTLTAIKPHGARIIFRQKSVGATVNALIFASSIAEESVISGCAREPHIDTLIEFLTSAGAEIHADGDILTVRGGDLGGGRVTVPGDMIEAGTYLAVSLATEGKVAVRGAPQVELSSFLSPLLSRGTELESKDGAIILSGLPHEKVNIETAPYPGFPTDLQPIAVPILALGYGGSITDTVWPERFGYLTELSRMGLQYECIGNRAEIYKSKLRHASAEAPDLRGGAALLISALASRGTSVISRGELLLRGYEDPAGKLAALGARIKYIE